MKNLAMLLLVLALLPLPAHAYIDVGGGSMFIQAIMAAGVGILMFFKQLRQYFLALFGKKRNDSANK
jgi:hypothetical protein